MKNILYVCAMEKEAVRIAQKLQLKQLENNLYGNENVKLLITGIGKQVTAINLTQYLCKNNKPELIINIGYAGSTNIQIGKWVNITRVYNYEWEIPGEEKYVMLIGGSQELNTITNSNIENVECYSAECFVTKTDITEHVAFDMELHSISLICNMYEIPLMAFKKISDNLSLDDYYENINTNEVFELESCLDYINF